MPTTKTDLIDRYLHAVKFWLPKAQQEDIIAELGEDLHSQVEEGEASAGHPLDEDEVARILRKRGAPMKVASSYVPEQRLINPAMLPVYRLVLKIVLLWVLAPLFAIMFLGPLLTSARPGGLLAFLAEAWRTGFTVVGIVTTVFALLDRYHVKIKNLDRWDPRKLPRVPGAQDTRARWNHLAGFIFSVLAAAFWAWLMWQPGELSPSGGGPRVIWEPVWRYVYWPVLGLTLASAAIDLLTFLYPHWAQVRSRIRIGIDACMLILAAILLRAGNLVEIVAPSFSAGDLAKAMSWVNGSIQITLLCVAAVVIGDAIVEIRRLHRGGAAKPDPIPTM